MPQILILYIFLIVACDSVLKKKENAITDKNAMPHELRKGSLKYDSILGGLEKNYVVTISEDFRKDLLRFYKKTEGEFKEDSIIYLKAVHDFYNSDPKILSYFVNQFKSDTTFCNWVYT